MAEAVVVKLEFIDIEHHDAKRRAITPRARPFFVQFFGEGAAVFEAGQRIVRGEFFELFIDFKQRFLLFFQRDARVFALDFAADPIGHQLQQFDFAIVEGRVTRFQTRKRKHAEQFVFDKNRRTEIGRAFIFCEMREIAPVGRSRQHFETQKRRHARRIAARRARIRVVEALQSESGAHPFVDALHPERFEMVVRKAAQNSGREFEAPATHRQKRLDFAV